VLIYTSPFILVDPLDHCWKTQGLLLATTCHRYLWVPDSAVLCLVCKLQSNQ